MKLINQKTIIWILVAAIMLFGSACSKDNNSGQGQVDPTKPPPQVRVEALPTLTPVPVLPTETVVAAPTVEAAAGPVFAWPTPNEDEIANQIESIMDEMDNKLKNQNFILKP